MEKKSISKGDCSNYKASYQSYCKTSASLFENIPIRPNHHYALNIGEVSRYFGPLSGLSEFSGERVNGLFQSLSNNFLLGG